MAKLPSPRQLPVLLLLDALMAAREHWDMLSPAERARLQALLVSSRGRRQNLTKREQLEVRRLAKKLDLPGLGRTIVGSGQRHRRGPFGRR